MLTRIVAAAALAASVIATAHAADNSSNSSANNGQQTMQTLPQELDSKLKDDGFTDVKVVPGSFIVSAKDKRGGPVTMMIGPNSMMMVVEVADASVASTNTTRSTNSAVSEFVSISGSDELSSNVVGLDVYNNENKNIGQIKDIAIDPQGRTQAFIISVGGFLGIGDHYVAVDPSDVKISFSDSDKKWHATMNATAGQLKGAPEFKYNGRWSASKS
jgi:sporulation protein YlmC with PRC-barrel domain